ncbi:heme oxygenase [Methylohalomonas lacus]|uniref:Heme oxygenase n=1 Tax=Methylohalomonas lacus TaxID=398773 RepID=A0AAE3HLF9_9GAMM|nr:biliverdin-producing heme oxygenase [Methylohalomonas lacus]MCS3902593.1 heme oxygenase [Methylohalomonas lacus]
MSDGLLLAQLRVATREQHARLESLPALRRLFADDYTVAEYSRLLQSFFSLFSPLEAAVQATGRKTAASLGYELRSEDLAADLKILAAKTGADTAVPSALTGSRAAETGCLYVLAGSRLGGKVIARQLAGSLGLTADSGIRFFAGSSGNEGHNWAQFCHRAELSCDTPPAREAAVSAAAATFDLFYQQLADE